jgi:hypothetical protein
MFTLSLNEKQKYYIARTVPTSKRKILDAKTKPIPLTHVHDHPLLWRDANTSIQSDWVNFTGQTSPLREMFQ